MDQPDFQLATPSLWAGLHLPPPDDSVDDTEYCAALDYLYRFSAIPRTAAAIRADQPLKLARMRRLLALAGNPQQAYPAVLVAGTKGKGSTAAMLAAILRAGGYRVGRYTQPHLVSYRERTWINGEYVSAEAVVDLVRELRPMVTAAEAPGTDCGAFTTFEVGTALTFLHLARARVDVAIIEVGVGGTYDATNVLDPVVSVIAPISADHLETLGPTLADVARAKAGILRPGRRAVIGAQSSEVAEVLEVEARKLSAPLEWVGRDWAWQSETTRPAAGCFSVVGPSSRYTQLTLPLLGRHQRDNAALAIAATHALGQVGFPVGRQAPEGGLASVDWPGRIQVLPTQPTLVVDGAHNRASADVLRDTLAECFADRPITLVLGCTEDKDLTAIAEALVPPEVQVIATRARHPRAAAAETVAAAIRAVGGRASIACGVRDALMLAAGVTPVNGLVVVAGSLFVAGEALASVAAQHSSP